jgi:hypothetical protein
VVAHLLAVVDRAADAIARERGKPCSDALREGRARISPSAYNIPANDEAIEVQWTCKEIRQSSCKRKPRR